MAKYICIILLFGSLQISAQDSLCVFKVNGSVISKTINTIKQLTKGDYLNNSSKVTMGPEAYILAIDKQGHAYTLNKKGSYKFSQILENRKNDEKSSLTSKYFKIVWNEILNKSPQKTIVGGVFRGKDILLFPRDGIKVVRSKLHFEWKSVNNNSSYFLFIRNLETDELLKISTNGTELTFYDDQHFLKNNVDFEWTVSVDAFPKLKNLPFKKFHLISDEEYRSWLLTQSEIILELKSLGMIEKDIVNALSETYGIYKL